MTKSNVGGKAVDIIQRLSGQEEEILRSELRKAIRDERNHDGCDKAKAVPRPLIPMTKPNVGSHAYDIDQPIEEVALYEEGLHHMHGDTGMRYAVMGQHVCRDETVSTSCNDINLRQQTLHHPLEAMHQTCHILPTDTARNLTPRCSRRRNAYNMGDHG